MADEVLLGEITCPSGVLVLMDGGYLGLWSGARPPAERTAGDGPGPAVDFEVGGPDAREAARTFDRGPGLAFYDVPAHWAAGFAAMFERHCAERGLVTTLTAHPEQIPHRERVRRALAARDPEFPIMGVPVVPVGGVPPGRPLPVTATPAGDAGWRAITVTVSDAAAVSRRRHGDVGLDHARLALADADALGQWAHDDPLGGRADVLLRGRDAAEAAAAVGAGPAELPGGAGHGWLDLPFDEGAARALALEEFAERHPDRRFATDLRAHSHQRELMARVRAAPAEAATIEVGGAAVMVAMTTAGEGSLPVEVSYDAAGAPVGIRITIRPAAPPP